MAKLTRRGFIGTSASAATIGVLASVPGLAAAPDLPDAATELPIIRPFEPLVAHVGDPATGEVSIMTGTREVVLRDTDLVMRLMKAAQEGGK